MHFLLLSEPGNHPKMKKSEALGYYTPVLHLSPHLESGCQNMCPSSSKFCREICLYYSGYGGMIHKKYKTNSVVRKRLVRTRMFANDKNFFMNQLNLDIIMAKDKAKQKGLKLAIRLNGTSDIEWENVQYMDENNDACTIIEKHPDVQFFDYTKISGRMDPKYNLPKNYHLILSFSGTNKRSCMKALKNKKNITVIFKYDLPEKFWDHKVINGDEHDLRFLDKKPRIIGLKAKGRAKKAINNKAIIE